MAFRCCGKPTPPASNNHGKSKSTEEELRNIAQVDKSAEQALRNIARVDKHAVLADMQELFKMFDANKNGLITKDEVLLAFKKMKIPILHDEIMFMFKTYDKNADDQLNYVEFSNMMRDLLQDKEYPVEDMFKYFDADDDGFITVEEFFTALRCLGIDVTEKKARELMTPHFNPGTEKINYDNFLKLMKTIMADLPLKGR